MYSVAARQRTLTFIHLTFGVAEQEQERGCVLILYLFIGVLIQNRDDTTIAYDMGILLRRCRLKEKNVYYTKDFSTPLDLRGLQTIFHVVFSKKLRISTQPFRCIDPAYSRLPVSQTVRQRGDTNP